MREVEKFLVAALVFVFAAFMFPTIQDACANVDSTLYSGVLLFPVSIFLAIEYLNKDLGWQSLIMFVTSVFILVYMAKK